MDAALLKATAKGAASTARLLLLHGADPNARDGRQNPVVFATYHQPNTHVLAMLLEAGAASDGAEGAVAISS